MKVLLVSDFGIRHSLGGAQRSNRLILDEGVQRGHDISIYHYDTDQSVLWDTYDVVISSNLRSSVIRPLKLINCFFHSWGM